MDNIDIRPNTDEDECSHPESHTKPRYDKYGEIAGYYCKKCDTHI